MSSLNPLEAWRVNNWLTVSEASELIGFSRTHFYEIVKGRNTPSDRTATRIQAQTGVTRSQLMAWKEGQLAPLKIKSAAGAARSEVPA